MQRRARRFFHLEQYKASTWRSILSNRVLQQQRRGTRAGRVPREIPKAWRTAAVRVPNLLPHTHRPSKDGRGGERRAVAGSRRAYRAVPNALYEGAHEEVLDLVNAKPAVSPRMVTGSVKLKNEQQSKHQATFRFEGLRRIPSSASRAAMRSSDRVSRVP